MNVNDLGARNTNTPPYELTAEKNAKQKMDSDITVTEHIARMMEKTELQFPFDKAALFQDNKYIADLRETTGRYNKTNP